MATTQTVEKATLAFVNRVRSSYSLDPLESLDELGPEQRQGLMGDISAALEAVTPKRTNCIYQIEVCKVCGGQLNNKYNRAGRGGSAANGRCGTSEAHWDAGGVLLDVTPVPIEEQREPRNLKTLVHRGVVPS